MWWISNIILHTGIQEICYAGLYRLCGEWGIDLRIQRVEKPVFFSRMAFRLWAIMMILVVFTVAFMWIIQSCIMEKSYTNMVRKEIEERLEPVMEDLKTEDLAYNENLIPYLSKSVDGKMMLVNGKGELKSNNRPEAYEIGIPVLYNQEYAYVILHRSFSELYTVMCMYRQQLIVLSILLTLVSSFLAILLSRKFIKPIHAIKRTVDTLRKEVIANVSHELRSPLALIGGYAEMVSDILDYSQLQSGFEQLKKEWYNLYEIAESEVIHCEQNAAKH